MVEFIIRPTELEDADGITEIFNQRYVAANTMQIPYTPRQRWRERLANNERMDSLVADAAGKTIGTGGLARYDGRRVHVGTIGMSVHQDYHSQGVGTALMEALMDLADNWHNLGRIELEVYTDNLPGIRLYEKFGFEIEGTLRAYSFRDGAYADAYYMARLRERPPRRNEDGGVQ